VLGRAMSARGVRSRFCRWQRVSLGLVCDGIRARDRRVAVRGPFPLRSPCSVLCAARNVGRYGMSPLRARETTRVRGRLLGRIMVRFGNRLCIGRSIEWFCGCLNDWRWWIARTQRRPDRRIRSRHCCLFFFFWSCFRWCLFFGFLFRCSCLRLFLKGEFPPANSPAPRAARTSVPFSCCFLV